MKRIKNILSLCLALAMAAGLLAGCGGKAPAEEEVYQLRIGNTTSPGDTLEDALEEMAAAINERSEGRINAVCYPSGQLGTLRTMTEDIQNGQLEMSAHSAGGFAAFYPVFAVFELPYLYNSYEEYYSVVDGPIMQDLVDKAAEATGVRVISYWMAYFRQTTNNVRPIKTIDDFKGIVLRTPETETIVNCMDALGASPVALPSSELYTALANGTVNGQENPLSVIYSAKYYEQQKYLSLTGHVYGPICIQVSEKWYQGLPDDLRTIVDEELKNAQAKARAAQEASDAELRDVLAEYMEINEFDATGAREAVQPAYDKLIAQCPEAADVIAAVEAQLGR